MPDALDRSEPMKPVTEAPSDQALPRTEDAVRTQAPITAARDDKLRALVKKGLTYPQVAKKMGCTEGQIIGHVSYLKVKGKPVNR